MHGQPGILQIRGFVLISLWRLSQISGSYMEDLGHNLRPFVPTADALIVRVQPSDLAQGPGPQEGVKV